MLANKPLPSNLQYLNCLVGPADDPMDTILNLGPNNTIEWFGTNLSSDPEFYAWSADNPYTLGQDSPCIDAGTTDFSIFTIPDWYVFPPMIWQVIHESTAIRWILGLMNGRGRLILKTL